MSDLPIYAVSLRDHGLWRRRELAALLRAHIVPAWRAPAGASAWLGWGSKASGRRAQCLARRDGLACLRLEDGFLRGLAPGRDSMALSMVVDDTGIYYDASRPSALEALVRRPLGEDEMRRAHLLRRAWCAGLVSKYNHARDFAGTLAPGAVLVVDQTRGDASIAGGLADAQSFARMLQAACEENPGKQVLLKLHPEVVAGHKQGHFALDGLPAQVRVLADELHPARLLAQVEAVYVVTSQLGFEALLWGKRVRTFGMPFYAGWGLTEDALAAPPRRGRGSLAQLVHAALVTYPRYVDPHTGQPTGPEETLAWIALQRRMRQRFPAVVHACGFPRRKRAHVRDFLAGSTPRFIDHPRDAPPGAALAVWGHRLEQAGITLPARPGPVLRLEDGFLRSVGLGAALVRPLSWVVDDQGIYYDARSPSRLETLLREHDFDDALRARAADLRTRLCRDGVTKYNVGAGEWRRPAQRKRVVLVAGQVESDASIRHGASGIRRNIDLLRAVRAACPDAHVVYKPHPDVLARLRRAGLGEDAAHRDCDEVLGDVPFSRVLGQVDEVHVLTSLAGFEALLRGCKVVTYGQPFYAGWGLTQDLGLDADTLRRRGRRLSLDELVAGTLLLYPVYVSARTRQYCEAERIVDELREDGERGVRPGWWRRMVARLGARP
ncbi:Capsular polysaccharide biosynthesis/export periplasmic protein WcbA; Capsular polysaccharide export system protein KpsC [plant metagenome]|uniref:Capsular polysaccharide biosynthesis/export periplasmic protein WcbA Capsular polysaccharide export system protein KpsC n=1 Tax=plant metagenome TaxID=1297885 RepID=A0A484V3P8_9ZZZZ